MQRVDLFFVCYGMLPDQQQCEQSAAHLFASFKINVMSMIGWVSLAANYLEHEGQGTLAVVTSVAGDRGRRSNYIYGAAKGALSIFLQGVRLRLQHPKIQVLTIKPSLVDTPMTKDFNKGILWASPEYVGQKIVAAIEKKRSVVYIPAFWRGIMLILQLIPECIFKRLKI